MCAKRNVDATSRSVLLAALRADSRIGSPLFRVLYGMLTVINADELVVLELRLENTLDVTGRALGGITRERVRQLEARSRDRLHPYLLASHFDIIQSWETTLASTPAASEVELFEPLMGQGLLDVQYTVGRIALTCAFPEIAAPLAFRHRLTGWWTQDADALDRMLKGVVRHLPFRSEQLDEFGNAEGVPKGIPLDMILGFPSSPAVYSDGGAGWVRRRARHRDAAWLILTNESKPLSSERLAHPLGLTPRVLNANLVRDHRFLQSQPSGEWSIRDWTHLARSPYATTLEAVVAVLSDKGPLPLRALVRQVNSVYPVTIAAITHCLNSNLLGRWPDGRVGLSSDGAPLVISRPRTPPPNVEVKPDGSILFTRKVDADLVRGSGTGLPRFIGYHLGLTHAPMSVNFNTASGFTARVSRTVGGLSISTLREELVKLGAEQGCMLQLHFHSQDALTLKLVCDHEHRQAEGGQ
jgi:hypothetical protein